METEEWPKGWVGIEWTSPTFVCRGCGSKGNVTGWRREGTQERVCNKCGPFEVKVPKVVTPVKRSLPSDGTKRRGRPKGSQNRPKEKR